MKTYLPYNPLPGTHIESACREAMALATKENRPVRFRFNGTRVCVNKRLSLRHLLGQWEHSNNGKRATYRDSQSGRDVAAKRKADIEFKQSVINGCLAQLEYQTELSFIIPWLETFTHHADDIDVRYDKSALADQLEAMGYADGYGVGRPPEDFKADSDLLGRYIVGQSINCLRNGMPPHQVLLTFAKRYKALCQP